MVRETKPGNQKALTVYLVGIPDSVEIGGGVPKVALNHNIFRDLW